MLSMSCDHPDIEEFIDVKNDLDKVNFANISIRMTNDFMNAVKNDEDFTLSFTRQETGELIEKTVRAKDLFHKIAENNWRTGEPGMLFWDTIEGWNLLSSTPNFEYAGTNPCGEEPLPAGGSCLLGSMNLSEYVVNPFTADAYFDFNAFANDVTIATYALNEVLDEGLPLHPLQEQRDSVAKWRQVGLGIMGLADMLIKMGMSYGDESSIELCNSIGSMMANMAMYESAQLANVFGAFPEYNWGCISNSAYFNGIAANEVRECVQKNGLRNSQLLTTAPTGTLSTMLGISGGIEPIFANYYTRTTKSLHNEDVEYKVYTPIVQKYMQLHNIQDDKDLPDFFVTAQTLDYHQRIAMQAVWQRYIDASISSTVNVPNEFTVEDVENLYMEAWENGLKGITLFRDGCERAAILNINPTKKEDVDVEVEKNTELKWGDIIVADDNVIGLKRKLMTGCGSLHCSAFFDPITGELMETYLSKGSTGGCLNSLTGLSRMISLAARAGVPIHDIVDQLESTGVCPSYAVRSATKGDTSKGSCCPVAVGRALMDMYNEMQASLFDDNNYDDNDNEEVPVVVKSNIQVVANNKATCPTCGDALVHEGGCDVCKSCGWSRCG